MVDAPSESDPRLSLVKAFAAIAKESDALGETAVSEVFASLEVHEEAELPARRDAVRPPVRSPSLGADDMRLDRRASPATLAGIVLGAGVLVAFVYLMLGS